MPTETQSPLKRTMNSGGSIYVSAGPGVRFKKEYGETEYKGDAPSARRLNQGGSMTRGGVTTDISAAQPTARGALTRVTPSAAPTPNAGGSMTQGGQTTVIPPGQPPAASAVSVRPAPMPAPQPATPVPTAPMAPPPVATPGATTRAAPGRSPFSPSQAMHDAFMTKPAGTPGTPGGTIVPPPTAQPVVAPPQSEARNPMSGAQTNQTPTTTASLPNPAQAMGFSSRNGTPAGSDAMGNGNVGGTGLYAKRFNSQKAASVYSDYVRKIFGA